MVFRGFFGRFHKRALIRYSTRHDVVVWQVVFDKRKDAADWFVSFAMLGTNHGFDGWVFPIDLVVIFTFGDVFPPDHRQRLTLGSRRRTTPKLSVDDLSLCSCGTSDSSEFIS